jgi:predicted HTH transcriptional regulator
MIPKSLTEWSIPGITNLLIQGYYETEFFDFKEMLPPSRDDADKIRLSKSCCAFANSSGGFLVFGVKDDKSLPPTNRLVGFDPSFDFPEQFGSYPKNCNPSIAWNFLNPPLQLENGRVIHIVEIPRSWNAPHCIESGGSKGPDLIRRFIKRTNKGNEDMSYEEVRMAFLQYYEKRLKLQLLQVTKY